MSTSLSPEPQTGKLDHADKQIKETVLPPQNGDQEQTRISLNFADISPCLNADQARIEAARCYFCYDAPCIKSCPTSIDIPGFINSIATGNLPGAGIKILDANILGGSCARVCPTEILCEGACVRTKQHEKSVEISALQRVATDALMARVEAGAPHPFSRATSTNFKIAIVGAGPAGLSCAHTLARQGYEVTLFDARQKAGGLNEYGIAAYKMTNHFAAREVDFVLGIGGITLKTGMALGKDFNLKDLQADFDAVFLAVGQTKPSALGISGEALPGVRDAITFIEELRQAKQLTDISIGREVVVIGGGNTAIDAATQAKRLGAEVVTIVYRRGRETMKATNIEQDWALTNGVALREWAMPISIEGADRVNKISFARTHLSNGRLVTGDETFTLRADMVLKAIGQNVDLQESSDLKRTSDNRIHIDSSSFSTSLPGVFAGGDCVAGQDLTVQAVEDGKRAAAAIHYYLNTPKEIRHG